MSDEATKLQAQLSEKILAAKSELEETNASMEATLAKLQAVQQAEEGQEPSVGTLRVCVSGVRGLAEGQAVSLTIAVDPEEGCGGETCVSVPAKPAAEAWGSEWFEFAPIMMREAQLQVTLADAEGAALGSLALPLLAVIREARAEEIKEEEDEWVLLSSPSASGSPEEEEEEAPRFEELPPEGEEGEEGQEGQEESQKAVVGDVHVHLQHDFTLSERESLGMQLVELSREKAKLVRSIEGWKKARSDIEKALAQQAARAKQAAAGGQQAQLAQQARRQPGASAGGAGGAAAAAAAAQEGPSIQQRVMALATSKPFKMGMNVTVFVAAVAAMHLRGEDLRV